MNLEIPFSEPDLGEAEAEAAKRVILSRWLTMGRITGEFERDFAAFVGARHAVAVSSCTAALHLAHAAIEAGPGDEIIVPSLTFVATANAVRYVGAKPVFADACSLDDWTLAPSCVERLVSTRTKAIVVVHYGGYACDMERIRAIATERGLRIIEDCAHAPGAKLNGRSLGTWGDIGCFSFYSTKNMTTGEGGMVVTDDDGLAEKVRLMRSHGITSSMADRHSGKSFGYDVVNLGFNYRPTEICSAIGRVQLERLPELIDRRQRLVERYSERLPRIEGLEVPFRSWRGEPSIHLQPVLLPKGPDRSAVMRDMRQRGVQTSVHYRPVHTLSDYADNQPTVALPRTDEIGRRVLTLPLFSRMRRRQVEKVCTVLEQVLARCDVE